MLRLKSEDVTFGPGAKAVRLDRGSLDAGTRIIGAPALVDAMCHECAERAQEVARRGRGLCLGRNHLVDMHPLQQRDSLVAVLGAKPLEDIAADSARLTGQGGER